MLVLPEGHPDRRPLWCMSQRVLNKIDEELCQELPVPANVVTHVDFLIVRRDEVISAEISINLVGEPVEVHHGDGIVDQQLFTLAIKAKPADIHYLEPVVLVPRKSDGAPT